MQGSNKSCHKDKKLLIAVSNHSIDNTKYKVAAKYALMRCNSPSKQPLFVKVVVSHSLIQSNSLEANSTGRVFSCFKFISIQERYRYTQYQMNL